MPILPPESLPPGPWQRGPFVELSHLPEPQTPRGWLERADIALSLADDPVQAFAAARAGLELVSNADADGDLTGGATAGRAIGEAAGVVLDLSAIHVGILVESEQLELAEDALHRRVALLADVGYQRLAELEERLNVKLYGQAEPEDADQFRQEFATAREANDAESVCAVASVLTRLLWQAGQLDDALAVADQALDFAPYLRVPERRAVVHATYGALYEYSELGEHEARAVDLLTQALDSELLLPSFHCLALRSLSALAAKKMTYAHAGDLADVWARVTFDAGAREQLIDAWLLAASYRSQVNDDVGAAVRAQLALEVAGELPAAAARRIRFQLGQYLMWSGRSAQSAACFATLHREELAASAPEASLGQTLLWYARAAEQADDLESAATARSEAITLGNRTGGLDLVAEAALDAARMYLASDSPQALDYAELAVETARKLQIPGLLMPALEHRGRAKAFRADPEALADFDEAIELALEHQQDWQAADAADSKGRFLAAMGRVDESVQVLFSAADAFSAAGDPHGAAMAELAAARSLREAERGQDAGVALDSCLERLRAMEAAGHVNAGSADLVKREFDAGR